MLRNPIDQVIDEARGSLRARLVESLRDVESIREALAAYVRAAEAELAADFAAKAGIKVESRGNVVEAAMELRALVMRLPELSQGAGPARAARSQPEPAALRAAPGSQEPAPSRAALPDTPVARPATMGIDERKADILYKEFSSIALAKVSDALFLVYAQEFAARARLLQDEVTAPPAIELGNLILRTLSGLARQRPGSPNIIGTLRAHTGDWPTLAARAREERNALLASPQTPPEGVARTVVEPPPAAKAEPKAPAAAVTSDEPKLELPLVRAAVVDKTLVLFGGTPKEEKLERVRARTGLEVEWVGAGASTSTTVVTLLVERIKSQRVAGLILLKGLAPDRAHQALLDAAKKASLPVAYAEKADKGGMVRALLALEEKLRSA